jgi:hypothetical protein
VLGAGMTRKKSNLDKRTIATIDRIAQDLLVEIELQTQAALALTGEATRTQREAILAELAHVRGRLVRLQAQTTGATQLGLATDSGRPTAQAPCGERTSFGSDGERMRRP